MKAKFGVMGPPTSGGIPGVYHPNLSGSETDVSTSTENLTQVRSNTN